MRTFDLASLYRATVGFDQLFEALESGVESDWPPYDIEKLNDDAYRISMALAGFAPSDIEIAQEGSSLVVVGRKDCADDPRELLHHGIADTCFRRAFSLATRVKVTQANLVNGILSIDLVREVPEELKPRRIEIGIGPSSISSTPQRQLGRSTRDDAQAA